jgi:hypothetical protein
MYCELVEILNKGKKIFLLLHIHHRNNANVNFASSSHGAGSAETGEGGVLPDIPNLISCNRGEYSPNKFKKSDRK